MEVTCVLGSSADTPKDSRYNVEATEVDDWAIQYQAYLDNKEAIVDEQENYSLENQNDKKVLKGEDWAVQYAEYCVEKENEIFSSYQNKN